MHLETLNSKESPNLPRTDIFETGQFELWFQPVYKLKTGAVLHNEVLLRWRDNHGNLHLPEEFLSSLSGSGTLQQLDQTVIRKAAELLAQLPEQYLSVNLSGEGLTDFTLIEYIQTVLDQSGVNPKQLSFELTETAIAKDFPTARAFTRELKSLGCSIVLDNFASRDLTLFQCQQLAVDLVKVDGQLVQRLKTDPSSRVLTQAILKGVKALSEVSAKFITDAVTLDLVREVGIDYVQGYHLKPPNAEPDWTQLVGSAEVVAQPAAEAEKPVPWRRIITGTSFLLAGVAAASVGIASIGYRFVNLVVDDGLINGRIVRLQAPVAGNVTAFYARPGALVKSGQVLARINIERTPQEEQVRLQLERSQDDKIQTQLENSQLQGQVQANAAQLAAARQSMASLKNQLQSLESQYNNVQLVDVQIASQTLSQQQAAVEAAIAKATSARLDYERYQFLLAEGGVSKKQTELLQFAWQSAEAEVKQAQAALRSAQTSLSASQKGVALSNQSSLGGSLSDQRSKLLQAIQSQEMLVSTLEAQVTSGKQQLNQAQSLYKNRPSQAQSSKNLQGYPQVQDVSAPFAGVVYSTEREQGEQVTQSQPILTLLDCNELWVETVVSADQASSIDTHKPASVQLAGYSKTVPGEVDLIQPISSIQGIEERSKLMQVQALLPAIPPKLVGQPLVRVTVRIPPPPQHTQSQQFCGLGQATQLTFSKKPLGSR